MQSGRYANSTFKYITTEYKIRFACEATGQLTRFTDYADVKYRSRRVFSFHRPETLLALLAKDDTIRNNMKRFPAFDTTGFRKCQTTAIQNLDASFADNRPKALVQMATGAGKTFTAITAAYRYAPASRISIYDYSQLIFSTMLGFFIFGQVPDGWSFLGYGIICLMAIFMFVYNNRKEKCP